MKKTSRKHLAWLGLVILMSGPAAAQEAREDRAAADAWDILAKAGRQASDLRVRIVYSLSGIEGKDGAFRLGEAIPVETLVDQVRGSTDPIVLSLMVDRCSNDLSKAGRCDAVDLARRWTVADTQNQLAWIALATVLANRGDIDAARTAFRRAAQASQWREYYPEIGRALEMAAPQTHDAKERTAMLLAVLTKSFGSLPNVHYQTINNRCKEVELIAACGRILETMSRDARSLMTLTVAAKLATARNALPPATMNTVQQRADAMHWASLSSVRQFQEEPDSEAEAVRSVSYLEALIAHGEIEMLRGYLQRERLGESEAARNYVATLSPEQLARRTYPSVKATSSTS